MSSYTHQKSNLVDQWGPDLLLGGVVPLGPPPITTAPGLPSVCLFVHSSVRVVCQTDLPGDNIVVASGIFQLLGMKAANKFLFTYGTGVSQLASEQSPFYKFSGG